MQHYFFAFKYLTGTVGSIKQMTGEAFAFKSHRMRDLLRLSLVLCTDKHSSIPLASHANQQGVRERPPPYSPPLPCTTGSGLYTALYTFLDSCHIRHRRHTRSKKNDVFHLAKLRKAFPAVMEARRCSRCTRPLHLLSSPLPIRRPHHSLY
jgi:hypothetical protein